MEMPHWTLREPIKKFELLKQEISKATGKKQTVGAIAEGFIEIAVENMANAIKKISVERGHDVSTYTLCCFGGAGGQHACLIADKLGIRNSVFFIGTAECFLH